MGAIDRYQKNISQRLGNDSIYGQGTDGDAVISSNTTLTADKYYNNLTINSSVTLLTNGFRLFVKGALTNNGYIGVGAVNAGEPTSTISPGTIQGTSTLTAVNYNLGGTGGGGTANTAPNWLVQDIKNLIDGQISTQLITPQAGQTAGTLYGGVSGVTGAQGHTNPAYTNSDTWTGKSGNAGSPGNAGSAGNPGGLHGHGANIGAFHHTHNIAGHHGNSGNAGATGNAGASGTAPNTGGDGIGGAGGAGGVGGGLVLIFAKTITGSGGVIFAKGKSASAGSAGQTGAAGTAGASGNTGANGNAGNNGAFDGYHTNHIHHNHDHDYSGGYPCNAYDCSGGCTARHHGIRHHYVGTGGARGTGGAGGTGGVGSPTKTGGTGVTGGAGGGGAIIIVTDSTPVGQTYTLTKGSTSGTGTPTDGFSYIIYNQ